MPKTYVAYYRVSRDRQGKSGLGLEAQKAAVTDYLKGRGGTVIEEFVEVESGKRHENRPELLQALSMCQQRRASLIIAKLDRLGRNAAFLMKLRDSGAEINACDVPQAGTLEFGIRAVFAQHEREEACERTKVALAAAKARGVRLGKNGKKLAKSNKAAADKLARRLAGRVKKLQQEHKTLQSLADALNIQGIASARGGKWQPTTVMRLLDRMRHL